MNFVGVQGFVPFTYRIYRQSFIQVWKMRLVQGLYEAGYNRKEVVNLFNVIDWLLALPQPLEAEFWQELQTFEEGRKVPYITSVERIGYDRGKKEGRDEEAQQSLLRQQSPILRQLTRKVGTIPEPISTQIQALSIAQLDILGEALFDFEVVADLENWLTTQS